MNMGKADERDGAAGKHHVETPTDPISIALKRLHETVVAEDVPEDFLNILAEIDRKLEADGDPE